MSTLNLPPSWHRMGFAAKAAYLCSSHQARSYPDACSMLAKMRGRKRRPAAILDTKARAKMWWNRQDGA